jgi:glycosyltransferase involved in cell wall biosynthesis
VTNTNQQLSILMVAPQPFFRARGTPFSVLHRIRALVMQGHLVTLVTYPFGEDVDLPGLTIVRCGKPPLINDIKIGPSAPKLVLDVYLYRETVRQLRKQRFDVIHSHEEAAFFVVGLARRFGIPHIYDMHSSLPQQLGNFGKYNLGPIKNVFERLERYVVDTCDGVITICPDLGDLIEQGYPAKRHSMIENTADDTQVFPAAGHAVRDELGLADKRVVLYTGTFETYQGLDLLTDAFRRVADSMPSAHLVMVGGRPAQVDSMRSRVEALGLDGRVSLVGTVHPSQIPAYLDAADLIVSPRASGTNTPLKIYGYLRSGVALVATDIFSHTQALTPDIAMLVPPTPEGLEDGIRRLLEDDALRQKIADTARRHADAHYSDQAYIDKVTSFYGMIFPESVVLQPGGRRDAAYAGG